MRVCILHALKGVLKTFEGQIRRKHKEWTEKDANQMPVQRNEVDGRKRITAFGFWQGFRQPRIRKPTHSRLASHSAFTKSAWYTGKSYYTTYWAHMWCESVPSCLFHFVEFFFHFFLCQQPHCDYNLKDVNPHFEFESVSVGDSVKIYWFSLNIAPVKKISDAILTEIQWIFIESQDNSTDSNLEWSSKNLQYMWWSKKC